MGFFSALVKGGGGTAKKTTTPVKVPSVTTVAGVAAAIVKGAATVVAATNLSKSYQKPKSSSGSGGGSKSGSGSGQQQQQQTPSADDEAAKSGDLIRWSGGGTISFFVKPTAIQGMKEISITASPETEDQENGDEKVTSLKKTGKIKITLTGVMLAALGADVEGMSLKAVEAARKGDTGYLYLAGKKMFTPQFMMTKADIKNIMFGLDGKWIQSEISMELSQCSKYDGGSGGGSGGGGGSSGKYYKVQISGMSELKVWATSVQGAVTKACGAKYTGYVTVDGTSHYVRNGRIDDAWMKEDTKKDSIKGANGATTVNTQNNAKKTSLLVYQNSKRKTGGTTSPFAPSVAFD